MLNKRLSWRKKSALTALIAGAFAWQAPQASATDLYFTTGTAWHTPANWTTDSTGATVVGPAVPSASDLAYFNADNLSGPLTVTLNADAAASGLVFKNTGATTLQSFDTTSRALTLGTAGIVINSGAGAVTIGNSANATTITLGGAQSWTNNSSNLFTIENLVTNAGFGLTLGGTGSFRFNTGFTSSVAAGGVALTIGTGAGSGTTVSFNNAAAGTNSVLGDFAINGGKLIYNGGTQTIGNALGVGSGSVYRKISLTNGGTFSVQTNDYNVNVVSTTNKGAGFVFNIGSGGGTFDVGSGRIFLIDDGVTGAGNTNTVAGTSNTQQLQGTGALTKTGLGILTLRQQFNFGGTINVTEGTLRMGGVTGGLGLSSAGTTIASGAAFDTQNFVVTDTDTLTVSGTGLAAAPAGVITNSNAGAGGYAGPIVLAGDSQFGATLAGSLTLSGGVTGAFNLTVKNASTGGTTFSTAAVNNAGTITNNGAGGGTTTIGLLGPLVTGIIQSGTSPLTLTPAYPATQLGQTITNSGVGLYTLTGGISGGTDLFFNANAAGGITVTGAINSGATSITNSGTGAGTTTLTAALPASVTSVVQSGTSGLTLTAAYPAVQLGQTITNAGGGLYTLTGGITGATGALDFKTNAAGGITVTGAINSGVTSITNTGTGTGTTILSAAIPASVTSVTQNAANTTLQLGGANLFVGPTTVTAGTLKIANATALGPNTNTASVASGAVLDLNGTTMTGTNALTLNGSGIGGNGALINSSGTAAVYLGQVSLATDTTIGGTGNITLGNATANTARLLGTSTLTKVGTGTLTLSTLTAIAPIQSAMPIDLQAGTLTVQTSATGTTTEPLGSGAISITPGATLNFNSGGHIWNLSNNFTIANATGTAILSATGTTNTTGTITFASGANTPTLQLRNPSTGAGFLTTSSGAISGTGNLQLNGSGASSQGSITVSGPQNQTGTITNVGNGTSTAIATLSGTIGSGITGISQAGSTPFTVSSSVPLSATLNTFTSTGAGTWTFSGASTFTGSQDLTFNANAAGAITVSGTNLNHSGMVTNSGTGNGLTTISSVIGTSVTEVIQDSVNSQLNVSGTNTTYAGGFTVIRGTLGLATIGSSGGTAANIVVLGTAATPATGATLSGINSQTFLPQIQIGANSNGGTLTIAQGTTAGATFSGNITTSSPFTVTAQSSGSVTLSGSISNTSGTGNNISLINNSTAATGLSLSGTSINQVGAITHTGTGTGVTSITAALGSNVTALTQNSATAQLNLGGTQTYTFTPTITAGLLQFTTTTAMPGYATAGVAGGKANVSSGGILGLNFGSGVGQFTSADVTRLTDGVSYPAISYATSGTSIGLDTTTAGATLSTAMTDPAVGTAIGLVKLGTNVLTISGANTYTGPTSVRNGAISISSINSVNGGTPLLASSSLGAPTTLANGTISLGYLTNAVNLTYTGSGETTDRVLNLAGTTGGVTLDQSGASGLLKFTSAATVTGVGAKTLTLQGSTAGTGELAGTISSATLGLTKAGTGTWAITGNNNTFAAITANAGNLNFSGTGNAATSITLSGGTVDLGSGTMSLNGATLIAATATTTLSGNMIANVANGDIGAAAGITLTMPGVISGTNAIDFWNAGGGTTILGAANTYSGATNIQVQTVVVSKLLNVGDTNPSSLGMPTTIGNGTISFGSGASAATLRYTGTGDTTDRALNLVGTTGGAVIDQSGTGLLKFTGTNTATGAGIKTMTLQGSTSGMGEIAGAIADNTTANTTGLTKAGTGTWTLSGGNTYTGATTVNGGKLVLTTGSTSTSAVTINNGGTLEIDGNYTIGNATTAAKGGSLTLVSGGTLDLADGVINTLTLTQNATFASAGAAYNGGTIKLDVSGAAADSISNGGGTVGSTSSGINAIVINPLSGFGISASPYTIIAGGAGTGSISSSNFYLASNTINVGGTPYSLVLSQSGKDLQLSVNAFLASDPAAAFWNGTTDAKWSTQAGGIGSGGATNWFAGATGPDTFSLPGANTNVTFTSNAATNLSTTLEQAFTINSLTFSGTTTANTAGSTIASGTGSNALTINAAALNGNAAGNGISVAAGSGANTISANVILGANQTWTNNSANALTVSGNINEASAGLTLAKAGTGTIILSGTANYTGATTISAGTLQLGNGGTTGSINNSAAIANSGILAVNHSNAITIGNNITGTGAFQQNGTGVTTLTGTNSYNGQTIVDGGTLFLSGNTTTTTGQYLVGNAANSRGILQIGAGTSLTSTVGGASAMRVGVGSGAVGVVTQNGGTVTLGTVANNYNLALGGDGGTTNSANTNYNFGAYNLNGGTAMAFQTEVGDSGGVGMMNITDGTFGNATGGRHFIIGRFGNSVGVVTLMGTGSATPTLLGASSTLGIGMGWSDNSSNNRQELNIGDKALVNASAALASNGLVWRTGTGTNNVGIANLLTGGTLQTGYIGNVAGTATSIFNFNGGKVVSTQTSTTFATTLTSLYVYSGGAIIDTNGFNDTVQAMLAPTGNGVNTLALSGSGYLTAPYVKITGDGVGATAVATIDGAGNITGYTITNPGVGYTTAPTVTLVGGGGTGTGSATIAANSNSGGLTKNGAGVLTLSGVNTFGGPIVINTGNVTFSNTATQTIPGVISGAGSLSQTGSGTTIIGNNTNSYAGITTITGGTLQVADLDNGLVNSSIGAADSTAASLVMGNGTLLYTGSTTSIDRNFTITAGTAPTWNISQAGTTLTLPGATGAVSTGGLTKAGLGALTLTGAQTYTGNTTVSNGTLNITGSLTGNGGTGSGSTFVIGNTAAQNAVINISNNVTNYYTFNMATVAGSVGVYNQTGGTVNFTGTGTGNNQNFVANAGYGYMNITGGTLIAKGRFAPNNTATSNAVMYIGGTGVLDHTTGEWFLMNYTASGNAGLAAITVGPGGQLLHAGASSNFGLNMDRNNGYSVLNIAGGLMTTSTTALTFGNGGTNVSNTTGLLNLAAGTLTVGKPILAQGGTTPSNNFSNFNAAGGTVQANAAIAGLFPATATGFSYATTIFGPISNTGVTGAPANFVGGLTIDTQAFAVTNTTPLAGATGNGVTQADLTVTGGAGYVGAPSVQFSRPAAGGIPATGYALISGGTVTGIVITNPGTYAAGETPTITLAGGGFTTAATVTSGALNTANANTGGLTKLGTGSLTLSGTGTFGGGVEIKGGLLITNTIANGGLASGIGQSSNAASNLLLNSATAGGGILVYNGTVAGTTDRNFTLANTNGGFDASGTTAGTFTINSTGPMIVASGLGAATLTLQGTGTGTAGAGSIGTLLTDGTSTTVGVTKSGAGTWTISNPANSYSGPTIIGGGILSVSKLDVGGANSSIGASSNAASNLVLSGGATLQYTGTGSTTDRNFTFGNATTASGATIDATLATGPLVITGSMTGVNAAVNTQVLTLASTTASGNNSINGIVNSNTGAGALTGVTKTGNGTWIIGGTSSYSGATTLSGGTLQFAGSNALSGATAIGMAAGTTLQIRDDAASITHTTNNITVSSAGTVTIDVGNNGGANTGSTVAFGALNNGTTANALTSVFNLTGANGYNQSYSSLALSGSTGNTTTINPTTTSVTITGNVTNQMTTVSPANKFDTLVLDGTSTGNAINGVISDAAGFIAVNQGDTRITKSNTSTWTLGGVSTYRGATTVNGGTLKLIAGSGLANTAITVNPVASGANPTFSVTPGSGTISLGNTSTAAAGATLTLNPGTIANPVATAFTMQDNLVGTVNLVQEGTFAGNALILGGTTALGYIKPSMSFDIGGSTLTDIDLLNATKSASVGSGGITLNFAALTGATALTPGNYTFLTASGGLSVGGALYTLGSSTISVGANTYSLSLTNSTATAGILTVNLLGANATPFWQGSLDGSWAAQPGGAGTNSNFATSQDGSTNTLALPDSSSNVTFTTTVASNLSTTLDQNFTINSLTFNGTGTSNSAGSTIASGTGTNTLTINAGAANGNTAGNGISVGTGSGTDTISANVTLGASQSWTVASGSSLVVSGNVNGTGTSLTLPGPGTVTLSGNNGYTGGTILNGGTLRINSNTALGSGALTVNVGSIDNTTAGLVTLTNNNAQTWTNGGVLTFVGSQSLNLGNGAVTFGDQAAATFTITSTAATGTSVLTVGGAITPGTSGTAGAKTLNVTGTGDIRLTGAITKGTATSITVTDTNSGTLTLSNAANSLLLLNVNGGAGSIIDVGTGNLTLNNAGNNSLQSSTGGTINGTGGGVLTLGGVSDNWGTANGTTLTINAKITGVTANTFEAFAVSSGTGVMVLANNANDFLGNVLINSGVLSVPSINNVGVASGLGRGNGTGAIALGNGTTTGVTLRYTGSGGSTNRVLNLSATTGDGIIDLTGSTTSSGSPLKFTSNVTATGAGIKTLTLTGSAGTFGEFGGAIVNNSATNTTAIAKTGPGTWIFSGANTYSGATTIADGTLQLTSAGTLGATTTPLTMGSTSGTAGSLDLQTSQTVGSLAVVTNGAVLNTNTITLAAGRSLTVNGATSIGNTATGSNNTVLSVAGTPTSTLTLGPAGGAAVSIGVMSGAGGPGAQNAQLVVTGGTAVNINLGTGALTIGSRSNSSTNASTVQGTSGLLDLSAAGNVNIIGTTNASSIVMGNNSTGHAGTAVFDVTPGTMKLSNTGTNTITVGTMTLGNSSNTGQAGTQGYLTLGNAVNNLNVDTIYVGKQKSQIFGSLVSLVNFAGTGGTLNLKGFGGGATKAALRIGYNDSSGTGTITTANMDLTGGSFNGQLSTLNIGYYLGTGTTTGGGKGTLTMTAGTTTLDSLVMANPAANTIVANTTGTLNLSGGSLNFNSGGTGITSGGTTATSGNATINLSGTGLLELANQPITINGTGSAINMTGGTLSNVSTYSVNSSTNVTNAGALIQRTIAGTSTFGNIAFTGPTASLSVTAGSVSTTGISTTDAAASVNLDGGTLNLNGGNIGGATAVVTNFKSGTLNSVAQINNGGAVSKTTSGTLTYTGTNAYTGATTVSAGKLVVNGPLTNSAVTVSSLATLGGVGPFGGAVVVSTGGNLAPGNSPGTMTFSNGLSLNANSNFQWELSDNVTTGAGTNWDQVAVTGGALNVASTAKFVPSFINTATNPATADAFWTTNHTWNNVFDVSGTGTIAGTSFVIDNSAWSSVGAFSTVASGTGVNLVWTIAPTNPVLTAAVTSGSATFGNVLRNGTVASAGITLTNTGGATNDITANSISGFTITPPSPQVVPTSGTATSTVTLNTATNGPYSGNLVYTANPGGVTTAQIAVSGNVGNASFDGTNSSTTFGAPLSTLVAALTNYDNSTGPLTAGWESNSINATVTGGGPAKVGTTATIVRYDNSSGGAETVSMAWRSRTTTEADLVNNPKALLSDVVQITGMGPANTNVGTFVLEMTYNLDQTPFSSLNETAIALSGELQLGWFNPNTNQWVNAIAGNIGGATPSLPVVRAPLSTDPLGTWGIDPSGAGGTGYVWAVLNHNSDFAVIPEPSTFVLGGLALLGFAGVGLRRRRRAKPQA